MEVSRKNHLRWGLVLLAWHVAAGAASAATLTVTSSADNGPGTLRAHLAAAMPGDVIDFAITGTITLTNGDLLVDTDVSILGPGPGSLTVERSSAPGTTEFRIFTHTLGTALISGLTLRNGRTNSGGALLNQDVLVLSNCVVTGNVATHDGISGGMGGGILNDQAPLEILSCVVSNNVADGAGAQGQGGGVGNSFAPIFIADSRIEDNRVLGDTGAKGGGIYNEGTAIITNIIVRLNQATGATDVQGVSGEGGGLFNASGATVRLRDSTIADNSAAGGAGTNGNGGTSFGGGVANDFGTVRLDRCTVSGNRAAGGDSTGGDGGTTLGGGLSNLGGTITITNSTISGNRVVAGAGGVPIARGGGIYSELGTVNSLHTTIVSNTVPGMIPDDGAGVYNLDGGFEPRNTIVAANNGSVDLVNSGAAATDSGGSNLFGTTNGVINSAAGDQFNVSGAALALGPLQNNGGLTETHALLCGSIAIDAGSNANAPLGDQRGFPRVVGPFADVGAFEASGGAGGAAGLVLTKNCPATAIAPGALLAFTGSISNSGGTLLTNVSIVNDQPAPNTAVTNFAQLAPGQSLSFTGSYLLPSNLTACIAMDTLTASAFDSCSGSPITTNASAACPVAHLLAITCPPTTNVQTFAELPAPDPAQVSVMSSAGGVMVVFAGQTSESNGCGVVITRTYRATDACSNVAMCSQTLSVGDTTPPMIMCSTNLVFGTDAGTCARSNVTFVVTAMDNGGSVAVLCSPASGSTFGLGTNPVQCVATDACGNTNACAFTVTIVDTEAPRITACATNRTLAVGTNCEATLPDLTGEVQATDNCTAPVLLTVFQFPPAGTVLALGTNIVTFAVVDMAGNSNTCQAIVTAADLTAPTIECPSDFITNTAPALCERVVSFPITAADNCAGVTVFCQPAPGAAFPKGTNVVTCTARDASSNTVECSFRIIVRDLEPPQALCPVSLVVTNDSGTCARSNVLFGASATDNCPGVTNQCTPRSGSTFAVGTHTVTCVATDAVGNTNACAFTVTVLDAEPPHIFNCATNRMLMAEANCQATLPDLTAELVVTDNCSIFVVTQSPAPGTLLPIGTNIVRFVVVDSAGNSNTCSAVLVVVDPVPPMLTCPSEIQTNSAPGACERIVFFTPTAMDNCPGVAVSCQPASGAAFPKGTNVVTCTARDASSNTVECSFRIIVRDLEPPQAVCPADVVAPVDAGSCAKTNVTFVAGVMDNCPGASVVCTPPSGSTFQRGTNRVSCTATDAAGNTNAAACAFAVIIRDTQPPVLTCGAANRTVECGTPFAFDVPLALDDCDGASAAISIDSTTTNTLCGNTFSATRVWRATDSSGNSSTCSQTVTVLDRQAPVVFCSSNLTVECGTPCDFIRPTAFDGCHGTNITVSVLSDTTNALCGMTYSATRTWRAVDPCSNVSTCSQTITFVDTRPPLLQCSPDHTFECPAVCGFDPPTVFDVCDGVQVNVTILRTITNASCGKTFSATRTWQAMDQCGNVSTCAQHIAIVDTRPPLVVCSDDRMVPCGVRWDFEPPFGYDLCAGTDVNVAVIDTVTNALCGKTIRAVRRWAVSDCATNTTMCTQTVTEVDFQPPVLNCGIDFSVRCGAPWQFTPPGASDNCDGTNVFLTVLTTVTNDLGGGRFEAVRVWAALDACLNRGTCTQTVVIDCARPAPRLTGIVRGADGATKLVIDGDTNCLYTIEGSDDLRIWRPITSRMNEDGTVTFTDPAALPRRFYRVVVEP